MCVCVCVCVCARACVCTYHIHPYSHSLVELVSPCIIKTLSDVLAEDLSPGESSGKPHNINILINDRDTQSLLLLQIISEPM